MRCICVSSLCGVCMWTPFLVGFMFAIFLCAMWLRVHAVYTRAMEGIVVGADHSSHGDPCQKDPFVEADPSPEQTGQETQADSLQDVD